MKYILPSLIALTFQVTLHGQDQIADQIKALNDNNQYDQVISKYASDTTGYSAKALYSVGMAYYMKEDDRNCLRFMDLAILKDPKQAGPYFIKASTYNYMSRYNEAIPLFKTAITLKPEDAVFYSGLGDSYYFSGKADSALINFKKATEKDKCPDRPFVMIAQIYSEQKNPTKSLEAYHVAKDKIDTTTESYTNVLFNIGTMESLNGNHDKAEPVFLELITLNPADYHSYSKLIQVYYHRKEFDKAKPYKDKLYEASNKGLLKDILADRFCIDQFKWKDHNVQVFERYENENKGQIYYKYIFYVSDKPTNVIMTVQSEFSPISAEMGGTKYMLCATKDGTHYNPGIGLKDETKYDVMKELAIKLFEEYLK